MDYVNKLPFVHTEHSCRLCHMKHHRICPVEINNLPMHSYIHAINLFLSQETLHTATVPPATYADSMTENLIVQYRIINVCVFVIESYCHQDMPRNLETMIWLQWKYCLKIRTSTCIHKLYLRQISAILLKSEKMKKRHISETFILFLHLLYHRKHLLQWFRPFHLHKMAAYSD